MGLCLSVALWKDKPKLCDGRAAVRRGGHGANGGGDGVCEYGVLGGGGGGGKNVLWLPEEKVVMGASPAAVLGVVRRGEEGAAAAAASGGTPARAIWQRRVLMGGRCRLPRFSGMILYDESGRPVCAGLRDTARDQEKHAAAISVLRDLL
ncbi:hypothetical protein ACP4OV_023750 [Aristida adscensionis]